MKKITFGIAIFMFIATASIPLFAQSYNYANKKYGYSLEVPNSWSVGFMGESKENADLVWFVSNKDDVILRDGGKPAGSKVEVMITDLKEMKQMDPRFPEIKDAKAWVDWERSGWSKQERVQNLKGVKDETMTIGGKTAVKSSAKDSINVTVLCGDKVYKFQYLGREPHYTKNKPVLEEMLKSLKLVDKGK